MGDRRKQALRVQFDGKLRFEFHGAKITIDAGLLAFRELDEAFRLTEKGSTLLSDSRRGKNTQHSMLSVRRGGDASESRDRDGGGTPGASRRALLLQHRFIAPLANALGKGKGPASRIENGFESGLRSGTIPGWSAGIVLATCR